MQNRHLSSATPRVALFNDGSILNDDPMHVDGQIGWNRHCFTRVRHYWLGCFRIDAKEKECLFGCHGNACPENSNLRSSVLHRHYIERSCRSSVRHLTIETPSPTFHITHFLTFM
jgi:hypothetical protein